ncbi:hypothetical protein [Candidatus Liberibacter sp.]|uniref:hypothetical protein n=1 Tax=Candidatus Liberibacter sp. TaxID=34022 RepID=UPI0015F5CF12|nr:hypothetical protein [Candidatus Liberibacter sp.]MBA5724075.1 hypothetical protein [Candidatus Liberibacter sp.]
MTPEILQKLTDIEMAMRVTNNHLGKIEHAVTIFYWGFVALPFLLLFVTMFLRSKND